jgi:hypothetical protein
MVVEEVGDGLALLAVETIMVMAVEAVAAVDVVDHDLGLEIGMEDVQEGLEVEIEEAETGIVERGFIVIMIIEEEAIPIMTVIMIRIVEEVMIEEEGRDPALH